MCQKVIVNRAFKVGDKLVKICGRRQLHQVQPGMLFKKFPENGEINIQLVASHGVAEALF
ncbi:hypothetical protein D3C81_2318170 [compost metagenome]